MGEYSDRVIDDFKRWYPLFYERSVKRIPIGFHLLLVVLEDGTKLEFSSIDNTLRDVTRTYDLEFNDHMSDDEYRVALGDRLKALMKDRAIKQETLADMVGISRQIMSRYVNGRTTPNVHIARRMARVLDCDIREIIDFDYILRD
mgnify:CR=1 FL=1